MTYDWDFGNDTPNGTGVAPSHTYSAPGLYPVTLVVNDGASDSLPVDTTADIAAPPPVVAEMQVHDLDAVSQKLNKGNGKSLVTIEV